MSTTAGILNLLLGAVYLQYGTLTALEMRRNWDRLGFSHFGAAWIAMAFTCGPHHVVHGVHLLFEGRSGGTLELIAVAVGTPAGVIWFRLRLEALFGGAGDRHISGTPLWIHALPTLFGMYLTAIVAGALAAGPVQWDRLPTVLPNVALAGLYVIVALYVSRTQIANRRALDGWSVSGLSLGAVFWTCAVMHGIYALYTLTDRYGFDVHGFTVDVIGVPAALYFVIVVRALYRGTFRDWNNVSRALVSARETSEQVPESRPASLI